MAHICRHLIAINQWCIWATPAEIMYSGQLSKEGQKDPKGPERPPSPLQETRRGCGATLTTNTGKSIKFWTKLNRLTSGWEILESSVILAICSTNWKMSINMRNILSNYTDSVRERERTIPGHVNLREHPNQQQSQLRPHGTFHWLGDQSTDYAQGRK